MYNEKKEIHSSDLHLKMLTIPQLEALQILPGRAIRRLVAEQKIPAIKVGTRTYINLAVFEQYLSGTAQNGQSDTNCR